MKNKEWLQDMAVSDLLNLLIQNNSDRCVLSMLGNATTTDDCDSLWQEDKSMNENCYNCVCRWLDKERKIF